MLSGNYTESQALSLAEELIATSAP
jgi:hypothetical protein